MTPKPTEDDAILRSLALALVDAARKGGLLRARITLVDGSVVDVVARSAAQVAADPAPPTPGVAAVYVATAKPTRSGDA